MILLIDNYDSFTYNIYQYLCELGADVEVVRNDEATVDEIAGMAPEKIVVSPGPCTPEKAGVPNEVVQRLGSSVPTLGVCLGHQCVGYSYGGTVGPAGENHARQDVPGPPQRQGRAEGHPQPVRGDTLPFPGDQPQRPSPRSWR